MSGGGLGVKKRGNVSLVGLLNPGQPVLEGARSVALRHCRKKCFLPRERGVLARGTLGGEGRGNFPPPAEAQKPLPPPAERRESRATRQGPSWVTRGRKPTCARMLFLAMKEGAAVV